MKIIVTCGPSYEPIDGARRMTNMSSGRLGITLTNVLSDAGHELICLKGEGSTFPGLVRASRVESFATNDDLARQLEVIGRSENIDAILHAAALCDFRVDQVLNAAGHVMRSSKFATSEGSIQLVLAPATKVLPMIRAWFPRARIVGWKYELVGSREDAFSKARKQISDCRTDACVLNGAAYGQGFALCLPLGRVQTSADAPALCESLLEWLGHAAQPGKQSRPLHLSWNRPVRFSPRFRPTHSR